MTHLAPGGRVNFGEPRAGRRGIATTPDHELIEGLDVPA
jgi:hypothetical protein